MSRAPETIWACESASGQCVVSFSTPSEDYRIEYRRADLLASTIGAKLMQDLAADVCQDVRDEASSYKMPAMAMGAAKCRDDILALPVPTDAEVLAAALGMFEVQALRCALIAYRDRARRIPFDVAISAENAIAATAAPISAKAGR